MKNFKEFVGTETEMLQWIEEVFFNSQWGQNPCVIFLDGDLGAGKSTFVRHFLKFHGVTGTIKSPTYSLVESYDAKNKKFHHFDLYRMQYSEEWEEMGFDEYLTQKSQSWCLIEWADKVFSFKNLAQNPADIIIHLENVNQGTKRKITINEV